MSLETNLVSFLMGQIDRPAVVVDKQQHQLTANPDFLDLVGYEDPEDYPSQLLLYPVYGDTGEVGSKIFEEACTNGAWRGDVALRQRSGQLIICRLRVNVVDPGDNGHLIYEFEIPKRSAKYTLGIDQVGPADTVTDLPGIYLLKDRIEQGIMTAPREGKVLAVMLMNIRGFAHVNKALGQKAGDQLLHAVGQRLKACVRNSDTVAHCQGDKFAVVVQISNSNDAVVIASKIVKALQPEFLVGDDRVNIAISIGISLSPIDSEDPEEMLKQAEASMNLVSADAASNIRFHANEINVRASHRADLENKLRKALANEEFSLFYQPKVNSISNAIVGMEGLIRWIHPELGIISPADFIPISEETGLIDEIGLWVIWEACGQNKKWVEAGLGERRVSVNVSGRQLYSPDFVDNIRDALEHTELPAHLLELEITESLLVANVEDTIGKLEAIRALGCHLSIDDFGTGYSSLSYLTRFPITTLKIDKSFVQGLESNDTTAEVAKAIISLSQGLKLEVVAEGAEIGSHVEFLSEHGCQNVQGFFYSVPLPAEKFVKLLEKGFIEGDDYVQFTP